ncbi:unnamed protein product [Hydatigera taeniaeformis]|uniref:BTB domain-containing protein n=1 Tax=Hydatigena taeniaeformis TaxID=6205 RepID=A0A0R3X6S6_HYDTA|nr:unnamed protein product [Hydatigera taeniaeformis]
MYYSLSYCFLTKDCTQCGQFRYDRLNNDLKSDLWKLAALTSSASSLSGLENFYVKSLSAHITPSQKKQNFNHLRLSQIPGRGSSLQFSICFAPEPMVERTFGNGGALFLEMMSRMVDNPICSDLSIYLDSGVRIFAHRFVLATWNPDLFLLKENTTSINAPGMSRDALLSLLRALYTFNLSILSSLSPEAEFTLDCWQMLDTVRDRIRSNAAPIFVDTPKSPNSSNTPDLLSVSSDIQVVSSHEVEGINSSADLFTSMTNCSALHTPTGFIGSSVVASHSTPHHSSQSVDIPGPLDKSLDSCPTSPNKRNDDMDQEKEVFEDNIGHSSRQSVEFDVDPPAFFAAYDSQPSLPLSEKRVTKQPEDVSPMPLEITLRSSQCAPSDHSLFFKDSVQTPAPLAKRLRSSGDSVEVDTAFSSSSQPIETSSDKGDTKNGSSDDDCQPLACFSQPLPTASDNAGRVSSVINTNVPITPKPVFEQFGTPELRKALSDYGVRRLPKKKAIQLLNHIYDELHPYVEVPSILDDNEPTNDLKPTDAPLLDCTARGKSSDIAIAPMPACDNSVGFLNTNLFKFVLFYCTFILPSCLSKLLPKMQKIMTSHLKQLRPLSISLLVYATGTIAIDQGDAGSGSNPEKEAANDTLRTRVWECLRNNDQLYLNIVTYVPLELDSVKAHLRDAGINVGLRRLTDMLDGWGVTFTTRSRHAPRPGSDVSDPRAANYLW